MEYSAHGNFFDISGELTQCVWKSSPSLKAAGKPVILWAWERE